MPHFFGGDTIPRSTKIWMNSVNAVCSFVSYSNAATVWGKVVWSTVLTGAAWVVRDFSAAQGYEQSWIMMAKDHFFCFVDMESWLILYLMPQSLQYTDIQCIYICIYLWTHTILHHPWFISRHAVSCFPIIHCSDCLPPWKSLRLRVQCAKFAFSASLVVCQKFWIRGCSELQREISWNDLKISCNL